MNRLYKTLICNKQISLSVLETTDLAQTALMTRWLHENNLANDANRINVTDLMTCQELVKRGIGWALLPEIVLDGFDGCIRPCTFANGEPFIRRMYRAPPRRVDGRISPFGAIDVSLRRLRIL